VGLTPSLEDGWVSPSYGVRVPAKVVVWQAQCAVPVTAAFLFAESRLTAGDRSRVMDTLCDSF